MAPRKPTTAKLRKKSTRRVRAHTVELADGAGGPCEIKKVSPNSFQVSAADMPLSMKLCDDQSGTITKHFDFNAVNVSKKDGTAVPGQPTNQTKTKFTINLPVGEYIVAIVLDSDKQTDFGYIYEDCGGSNLILTIQYSQQPSGSFHLEVV